jgi:molybdate transport system ATP-binding protein
MTIAVALRHRQGDFTLDVDFIAGAGITALFGPSGAGKTTILDAMAGARQPDSGHIVVGDRVLLDTARRIHVPTHRRRIGYVFQDGRLFPHFSVRGNLRYAHLFHRPAADRFDEVVALLGIGHLLDRRPGMLSGGERQRVAIGRALLAEPDLLLLDEPLAALDAARKDEILPYIARLREAAVVPVLYVTHSVDEVRRLADTVIVLSAGRVVRQGAPQAVPLHG